MDNKKFVSVVLASAIVTGSSASVFASMDFKDMPNNWARPGIDNALRHNLIRVNNGEINAFEKLTRADMASIVNRMLGLKETVSLDGFKDVQKGKWYYDEMAKAVKAGIFIGSGDELHPEDSITREEAFLIMGRVLDISKAEKSSKKNFVDYNKVSPWTLSAINGLVDFGYIQGDQLSRLNPKGDITRAEFTTLVNNIAKDFVQSPSLVKDKKVSGNLIISSSDVSLKNVKIAGDLIISEGANASSIKLDGVKVSGRVLVRGASGVKLLNSEANQLRVLKGVDNFNIEVDKDSSIKNIYTSSKVSINGDGKVERVVFKKGSNGSKVNTVRTDVIVEDEIVVFDRDGKEIKLSNTLNGSKLDKEKEAKKSYEILSIANVLDSKDTFVVDFGDKVKEENLKDRVITLEYLGKNVKSKYRLLDAEFIKIENGLATFKLIDRDAELEDRVDYRVVSKWISNKKEVKFTVETRINRREYDKLYDLIDEIYKLDRDKYERREYEVLMDRARAIDKKSRDIKSVIELQQYVDELTRAKNTLVPVGAADLKSRLNLRMEILRKDKLKLPKELEDMPESSVKDIEKKLEEVNKLLVKNDKVMSRIEKAQRLAEDRKYSDDKWIQRALEESKDLKDTTIEEREKIADKLETALADEIKSEAEKDLAKLDRYLDSKFEIKSNNLKEVKFALADAESSVKNYTGKDKLKGIENIKKLKDKITAFEKTGSAVDKTEKELEEAKKAYEAALEAASGKLDNIESLKVTEKNPTKADYEEATKLIKEAIKKADSEIDKEADKETDKEIDKETDKEIDKETDKEIDKEADKDTDKDTDKEKEVAEKEAVETKAKEAVDALFNKESLETNPELAEEVKEETIEAARALVDDLEDSDLKKELTIKILKAEVLEKFKVLEAEENKEDAAKLISEQISDLEKLEKLSEEDKAFVEKYKKIAEEFTKTEEDDSEDASEEDDTSLELEALESVMGLYQNK